MASPFDGPNTPPFLPTSSAGKPPKPPIHNPYDKFTQQQFDAWIGGITGALRQALGQDDVPEQDPPPQSPPSDASEEEDERVAAELLQEADSDEDEESENSFAEIDARRAIGKGKARDPRDGPGFGVGVGDKTQPIEIDLDSEEEDVQASEGESGDEYGSEEEWDEEPQSDEEARHHPWSDGETSTQARIRHERERQNKDDEEQDYEEDEIGEDYEEEYDEGQNEVEDEQGDFEAEEKQRVSHLPGRSIESKQETDIVVLSDGEEEGIYEDDVSSTQPQANVEERNQENEEESEFIPVSPSVPTNIDTHLHPYAATEVEGAPRHANNSPADQFHVSQDVDMEEVGPTSALEYEDHPAQEVFEYDDDDEVQEVQPQTAFRDHSPPHVTEKDAVDESQHLDALHDEEPSSVHFGGAESRSPDVRQLEIMQPLDQDTSFPRLDDDIEGTNLEYPVEISDPWSGPRTYAEDYYSGGDIPSQPGMQYDADHLGLYDDESSIQPPHKSDQFQDILGERYVQKVDDEDDVIVIDDGPGGTREVDEIASSPPQPFHSIAPEEPPQSWEPVSAAFSERPLGGSELDNVPETPEFYDVSMASLDERPIPPEHPPYIDFVESHLMEDGPIELVAEVGIAPLDLPDQMGASPQADHLPITATEENVQLPGHAEPEESIDTSDQVPEILLNDVGNQILVEVEHRESPQPQSPPREFVMASVPDLAEIVDDHVLLGGPPVEVMPEQANTKQPSGDSQPASDVAFAHDEDVVPAIEVSSDLQQHSPLPAEAERETQAEEDIQIEQDVQVEPAAQVELDVRVLPSASEDTQEYTVPGDHSAAQDQATDAPNVPDVLAALHEDAQPSSLPDSAPSVMLSEIVDISMEDVRAAAISEDKSLELLDQPSSQLVIEDSPAALIEEVFVSEHASTSADEPEPIYVHVAAKELPQDTLAGDTSPTVFERSIPDQPADVQEQQEQEPEEAPADRSVDLAYEDGLRDTFLRSPKAYITDALSDVQHTWSSPVTRPTEHIPSEQEVLELNAQHDAEQSNPIFDIWEAPPKFANGFISAGPGPFLLDAQSSTHFVQDEASVYDVFLEKPGDSSGVPSEQHKQTVEPKDIIGQESANALNGLYDDLQVEPMEGLGEAIDIEYIDSSAASTQVAALPSPEATLVPPTDSESHKPETDAHQDFGKMSEPTTGADPTDEPAQTSPPESKYSDGSADTVVDTGPVRFSPKIESTDNITNVVSDGKGDDMIAIQAPSRAHPALPINTTNAGTTLNVDPYPYSLLAPRHAQVSPPEAKKSSKLRDKTMTPSKSPSMDKPPATPASERKENGITAIQTPSSAHPLLPINTPNVALTMQVSVRKSTDPVLLPDPYPYSLSTPRHLYSTQYDEEANYSSSTSASTLDGHVEEGAVGNTGLRYPTGSSRTVVVNASEKREQKGTHDADNDADADGDIDPDFVAASNNARKLSVGNSTAAVITPVSVESTRTETAKPADGEKKQDSSTPSVSTGATSVSKPDGELPSILIIKKPPVIKTGCQGDTDSEELTDLEEFSPTKPKSSHALKRKHSASTMATSPTIRPSSTKKGEKSKTTKKDDSARKVDAKNGKHSTTKGKGKEKEVRIQNYKKPRPTQSISSRSSAGAGSSKMAHTDNRSASRASSIISNAASDHSSAFQPSPTTDKPNPRSQLPPPPPPVPLKHSHSLPQPRPAPLSLQLQRQTPAKSLPQSDAPTASAPSVLSAPKPGTSNQTGHNHKPAGSSYSSPVTRSNCRYHKISIPRDEDGPRIYFLVPGCSLTNPELIKEEEVLDHGDATPEDTNDIEHDLESLAFEPYLVGVMRLLVGVNMWEQEVYYMRRLDADGKELVPKLPPKPKSRLVSPSEHESPRTRPPASPKVPLFTGGSISTSTSIARKVVEEGSQSVSSLNSEINDEDDDYREGKRTKLSAVKSAAPESMIPRYKAQSTKGGPISSLKRNYTSLGRDADSDSRKTKKLRPSVSEPWTSR